LDPGDGDGDAVVAALDDETRAIWDGARRGRVSA
jgi:hypothetical protein